MNKEEKEVKKQKKYCKPLLAEEDIQIEPICEESNGLSVASDDADWGSGYQETWTYGGGK